VKTFKSYADVPEAPLADVPSSEEKTSAWRSSKPVIDLKNCTRCYICWKYCPDMAIAINGEGWPEVKYDYCKGCGICAEECARDCIVMEKEV